MSCPSRPDCAGAGRGDHGSEYKRGAQIHIHAPRARFGTAESGEKYRVLNCRLACMSGRAELVLVVQTEGSTGVNVPFGAWLPPER
jgi:hypothetical protein